MFCFNKPEKDESENICFMYDECNSIYVEAVRYKNKIVYLIYRLSYLVIC